MKASYAKRIPRLENGFYVQAAVRPPKLKADYDCVFERAFEPNRPRPDC